MKKLSNEEKQSLSRILEIIYGHDSELLNLKNSYNEKTVEATEKALRSLFECNENIKFLIVSLVSGLQLNASGWLKESLNEVRRTLESNRVKFDGLACRATAARNWKTEIVMSTYGI